MKRTWKDSRLNAGGLRSRSRLGFSGSPPLSFALNERLFPIATSEMVARVNRGALLLARNTLAMGQALEMWSNQLRWRLLFLTRLFCPSLLACVNCAL